MLPNYIKGKEVRNEIIYDSKQGVLKYWRNGTWNDIKNRAGLLSDTTTPTEQTSADTTSDKNNIPPENKNVKQKKEAEILPRLVYSRKSPSPRQIPSES